MNTEIFDLGKIGITLGYEYDDKVIYEKLTIVLYKGKSYISTKTTQGVSPEQDVKTWQLVAEAKDAYHMLVDAGKTTLTEEEFLEQLVDATKGRYIIQGNVINAADEEDLTVEHSDLLGIDTLKLSNRDNTNGMGYVILRKNKSFTEQVTKENTIYEVRYDFILNENVTIPANCVLKFNGGSIDGGNITLNNTEIIGSHYCLRENLNILGTHNDIDLNWLGISGNNPNNSSRFNLIAEKNYYFKSDIVFNTGDLEIPANCKIDGRNNKMRFTCESVTKGLIRLVGEHPILENIIFEVDNASFDDVVISVDTTDSFYGNFRLRNIEIWGAWFSNRDYKSTAIKIYCSNEDENTAFNYITGCQINNIYIRNVNIGIDITNRAENYNDSSYYAWLNEIYIINPIIHAKSIGIKTTYINNTVHNPAVSVGPVYVNNYEFQALNEAAIMCKHSGRWDLYITQACAYDCTIVGKVLDYGSLWFTQVLGNISTNGIGTDDDGEYTQKLGVRIYSNANFCNNIVTLTNQIGFANSDYSAVTGIQSWSINNDKDNLNILSKDTHKKSIIFKGEGNSFVTCHETISYKYYKTEKRGTLRSPIIFEYFNNYGVDNNFTLTKIERRSTNLVGTSIRECIGCNEVYTKSISNVTIDTIVVVKIKLLFKDNTTYTAYKANTFGFVNKMFSLRYVSANRADILKKSLVEENDNIFVVIKAKITETASSCLFNFDIAYNPVLTNGKEIVVDSNGCPDIKITDKDFVYGLELVSVTSTDVHKTFNIDSTTNNLIISQNNSVKKDITYKGVDTQYCKCHSIQDYNFFKVEKKGLLHSPIIFEFFKSAAQVYYTILSITRRDANLSSGSIRENIGCNEVIAKNFGPVTAGTIIDAKSKILFLNNATYAEYKANTLNLLNDMFSLRYVSINCGEVLAAQLKKEDDDIFVVIKAKINRTLSNCIANIDIAYNTIMTVGKEITIDSNDTPIINITDNDLVYGLDEPTVTVYKLSGTFANKPLGVEVGFIYFNTDTHKNITYGGNSKWYNPDGTEANA